MPKRLFFELDEDKRSRVVEAALTEFGQYGYSDSSTNRIVKKASISKGSLFKYFTNKEDMYFYILDKIITKLVEDMKGEIDNLPKDMLERAIKYSQLEFDWYIKNPNEYKLIKNAFIDDASEIYNKTVERYEMVGESFYDRLFEDLDDGRFKWDEAKCLNILKWFLKGFNEEFIKEISPNENMDDVKDSYINRLREYMKILKVGLYY